MSDNTEIRNREDLLADIKTMQLINQIISDIVTNILPNLTDEQFVKIGNQEMVFVPILDKDLIALLRLCDEADFVTLFMSLGELGDSFGFSFDIEPNYAEVTIDDTVSHTPFILSVNTYYFEDLGPDDDGGSDGDDPVSETEEKAKVLVMAAAGGKR